MVTWLERVRQCDHQIQVSQSALEMTVHLNAPVQRVEWERVVLLGYTSAGQHQDRDLDTVLCHWPQAYQHT